MRELASKVTQSKVLFLLCGSGWSGLIVLGSGIMFNNPRHDQMTQAMRSMENLGEEVWGGRVVLRLTIQGMIRIIR